MQSRCRQGRYVLFISFDFDVDVDTAYQDVVTKIQRASRFLPEDVDNPNIIKMDPSQLPVIEIVANSENMNLIELKDWADNWFQNRLMSVSGVSSIDIIGGLNREIRIELDPEKLKKYNISISEISSRISNENIQLPVEELEKHKMSI